MNSTDMNRLCRNSNLEGLKKLESLNLLLLLGNVSQVLISNSDLG